MTRRKLTAITSLHDIESMGNISRYEKGFYFEMNIQMMLDAHKISYEGNPIFYDEWKKYTNTGHDIRILEELHLKIECKYLSKPIYESWFKRDWLSRDADIYVTTDPYFVPYQCRKQLTEKGKKLFTPWEFICYILKLLYGNKCNLNRCPLNLYRASSELKIDVNIKAKYVRTGLKDLTTKFRKPLNQSLHRSQNVEIKVTARDYLAIVIITLGILLFSDKSKTFKFTGSKLQKAELTLRFSVIDDQNTQVMSLVVPPYIEALSFPGGCYGLR